MVVGVLRERHTPELHAQLREHLNGEPGEDVNVWYLIATSRPLPNQLRDTG